MKLKSLVVLLLVVVPLVLGACGQQTVQEANSAYCTAVSSLESALATVEGLTPESTITETQDALKGVQTALDSVKKEAENLAGVQLDAVQTAFSTFEQSVTSISGSDTLGAAAEAVKTAEATLKGTIAAIKTAGNCK